MVATDNTPLMKNMPAVPPRDIIIPHIPVAEPLSSGGSASMDAAWLTEKTSTAQRPSAALSTGNAAAAGPISGVIPAAIDEVSVLTAAHFALHGQRFQELSAQAARIQAALAATLATSGGSYAATEAANAVAAL